MKKVDRKDWISVVATLDHHSLIMLVVGGSRMEDWESIERGLKGLVRINKIDGGCWNLKSK